jgi:hypothetical protein
MPIVQATERVRAMGVTCVELRTLLGQRAASDS